MPVSTLAIYDERNMPHPTIRHTKCDILIEKRNGIRCRLCNEYRYIIMTKLIIYNNGNNYYTRPTLHSLGSKIKSCDGTPQHKSIHTNIRYLSTPERRQRMDSYQEKKKALKAKVHELKKFIVCFNSIFF